MALGTRRRNRVRQFFALVKEVVPEAQSSIEGSVIDWSSGGIYFKQVSANESFTFLNDEDGKTILVILENTSASPVTITFPAGIKKDPNYEGILAANSESVFTIIKANNKVYMAEVKELA